MGFMIDDWTGMFVWDGQGLPIDPNGVSHAPQGGLMFSGGAGAAPMQGLAPSIAPNFGQGMSATQVAQQYGPQITPGLPVQNGNLTKIYGQTTSEGIGSYGDSPVGPFMPQAAPLPLPGNSNKNMGGNTSTPIGAPKPVAQPGVAPLNPASPNAGRGLTAQDYDATTRARSNQAERDRQMSDVRGMNNYDPNGTAYRNAENRMMMDLGNTFAGGERNKIQRLAARGQVGSGLEGAADAAMDQAQAKIQSETKMGLSKEWHERNADEQRWKAGQLAQLGASDLGWDQLNSLSQQAENRQRYNQGLAASDKQQAYQREQDESNRWMAGAQGFLGLTGTIGGAVLAGPAGAGIGGAIGNGIGGLFGGQSKSYNTQPTESSKYGVLSKGDGGGMASYLSSQKPAAAPKLTGGLFGGDSLGMTGAAYRKPKVGRYF